MYDGSCCAMMVDIGVKLCVCWFRPEMLMMKEFGGCLVKKTHRRSCGVAHRNGVSIPKKVVYRLQKSISSGCHGTVQVGIPSSS